MLRNEDKSEEGVRELEPERWDGMPSVSHMPCRAGLVHVGTRAEVEQQRSCYSVVVPARILTIISRLSNVAETLQLNRSPRRNCKSA